MKYMFLSLFIFFYQLSINYKVKCNEEEIDLLKEYGKESTLFSLEKRSLSSLPSEISEFPKLEYLFLKRNNFTAIPPILSEITTLKLLDMNENRLKNFPTGVILENLKTLNLDRNEIIFKKCSDNEDSILNLDEIYPKLEELYLYTNQIEYIPILQSTSLKILDFCNNKITSISSNMFIGLIKLKSLILTFNKLTEINNNLGELKNLKNIDFYRNKIKTFILNEDCLENLKSLDLNCNTITEFKLEQSIVPKITTLSIDDNELSTIPSDIYNLQSLEELYLSFNNITEINDTVSNLKNLKILDLYKNKISEIPSNIYDLKLLTELYLSDNNITKINDSISNLKNLKILDLSRNKISKIPESISELTKLEIFTISFEYLEKDYVTTCVFDIINDENTILTYEYIESQKTDSKEE